MGATVLQFASMARDIEAAQAAETKRASSARNVAVKAPSAINVPSLAQAKAFVVAARNARDFAAKSALFAACSASYWRAFPGLNTQAAAAAWLDDACREAQRLIRAAITLRDTTTVPYTRGSAPTMAGFVAGMPDPAGQQRAALIAQLNVLITDKVRAFQARADTSSIDRAIGAVRKQLGE